MRKVLPCLISILFGVAILAAEQPKNAPPSDWRGIIFGSARIEVEAQLTAMFKKIRWTDEQTCVVRAEVAGERVNVVFYFGYNPATLNAVSYKLTRTAYDTVMAPLLGQYGAPTFDASKEFVFYPGKHHWVSWTWNNPKFSIIIGEGVHIYDEPGVDVTFVKPPTN